MLKSSLAFTFLGGLLGGLGLLVVDASLSALAALTAFAYGCIAAVGVAAIGAVFRYGPVAARARALEQKVADDQNLICRAYGGALSAALLLPMTAVLADWGAQFALSRIQDQTLADDLAFMATLSQVLVGALLWPVLSRALGALFQRVARHRALPWLGLDGAFLLFASAPLVAGISWVVRGNQQQLGTLQPVLAALALLSLLPACFLPPDRWLPRQWHLGLAAFALVVVVGAGLVSRSYDSDNAQVGDESLVASLSRSVLLRMGDFDADGTSGWLGGGDCAPFDGSIHPGAKEVPRNGVDEDCDGEDGAAVVVATRPKSLFSGKVTAKARLKNVVFIIVDAIRMDATSLRPGYKHRTTPHLELLAKESLVFNQAMSQSPATLLSIPAMLYGRNPDQMKWDYNKRHTPRAEHKNLPLILRDHNYHSGIILNSYIIKSYEGLTRHFDEVLDAWKLTTKTRRRKRGTSGPASTLAIRFMEEHRKKRPQRPFFLTVYWDDPHAPYAQHALHRYGKSDKAKYLSEIANSDERLGTLMDYLRYSGDLWDNTMVIFTADHGEEFREHGGRFHAKSCHVESVHVPLVVRLPGIVKRKKSVDALVGLVDIAPTILEAIGVTEHTDLDGQSLLVPALTPKKAEPRVQRCVTVSQHSRMSRLHVRGFRDERYAYIQDVLKGTSKLYDRQADPAEQAELKPEDHRSVVQRFEKLATETTTGNLADHTKF